MKPCINVINFCPTKKIQNENSKQFDLIQLRVRFLGGKHSVLGTHKTCVVKHLVCNKSLRLLLSVKMSVTLEFIQPTKKRGCVWLVMSRVINSTWETSRSLKRQTQCGHKRGHLMSEKPQSLEDLNLTRSEVDKRSKKRRMTFQRESFFNPVSIPN